MPRPASRKVYEAKETTIVDDNGSPVVIQKGERIREGHPYLRGRLNLFKEHVEHVRYDVETATASHRKADDE